MLISMRFYKLILEIRNLQKPGAYHYGFSQLALNTKFLLDKLKINKAHIVGHSMGGMLTTTFTLIYSSFIKKLILINPIGLEAYGEFAQSKDVNFFNYWN